MVQNSAAPPPAENSGSSTSSGGSSNYGTLGRGGSGGMASMMDEMAKTLARRRAAVSIYLHTQEKNLKYLPKKELLE